MGSTFYINTKPATIIGVAPKGFYGDRIDTNPPKYFLPMNAMDPVIGAPYFNDPDMQWAYIIGRVKPGTSIPALQAKASTLLKQEYRRRSRHLPISAPKRCFPARTWC